MEQRRVGVAGEDVDEACRSEPEGRAAARAVERERVEGI
jgi:hypothetical protein